MPRKISRAVFTILISSVFFFNCGFYSFVDSSIPAEIKTIKIEQFQNTASFVNPELAYDVTSEFRSLVASQTNLVQTTIYEPDLIISGTITKYEVNLLGINNQTQTADENQLVTVFKLSVRNNLQDKSIYKDVNTDIQVLKEFPADQSFNDVEGGLAGEIADELANLIFSKAFSNW